VTDKILTDALDFLGKHESCKALTTKMTVNFNWGGEEFVKFPMEAMCYIRASECGNLTKANFPNYKKITLAKSICSEANKPAAKAKVYEEEEDYIPNLTPLPEDPVSKPKVRHQFVNVREKDGRIRNGIQYDFGNGHKVLEMYN
jgi:hypothetical protein